MKNKTPEQIELEWLEYKHNVLNPAGDSLTANIEQQESDPRQLEFDSC